MSKPDNRPQIRKPAHLIPPTPAPAPGSSGCGVKILSPVLMSATPVMTFKLEAGADAELPMKLHVDPYADLTKATIVRYVVSFEARYEPGRYRLLLTDPAGRDLALPDAAMTNFTILRGGRIPLEWDLLGSQSDEVVVSIERLGGLSDGQIVDSNMAVLKGP